jgi:Heterokaryon incompatibility protein (HET)
MSTEELTSSSRRARASVQISMRRFTPSGKLQKSIISIHDDEYLAISHAWGDTEWEHIPGYDEPFLVSKQKAKFLAERLYEIVGDNYFWMDVMCVDQHNAEARVHQRNPHLAN